MVIESRYIFLSKGEELHTSGKETNKNVCQDEANTNDRSFSITNNINRNLIAYLEQVFPNLVEEEISKEEYVRAFRHQFRTTITYSDDRGNTFSVNGLIKTHEVKNNFYMSIAIEGNSEDELISGLETAQTTLISSGIKKDYIDIISYDAISEYYCNKSYSHLNAIERKLRELLFNIYVVNFEKEYYQMTISEEIQDKAKRVMQTRKETERLQQFFYSLEFNDIQSILFTSHWTPFEKGILDEFLKSNDDLSKLSDQELRSTFLQLQPHSDWERLFSDKMNKMDVEKLVEDIRTLRNSIAHCKFYSKKNYHAFITATNNLSNILEKAIEETVRKDFVIKNTESLRRALSSFSKRFGFLFKGVQITTLTKALNTFTDTVTKQGIRQCFEPPQTSRQILDGDDYDEDDIDG